MTTKDFTLAHVLTIAQPRLLCDIGGLYDILNWMTNDNLCTHQLPRAMRECQPWLKRWFPQLFDGEARFANEELALMVDAARQDDVPKIIADWLAKYEGRLRKQSEQAAFTPGALTFAVPRIPRDNHDYIDPIEEAARMVGPDRVIAVKLPNSDQSKSPKPITRTDSR